MTRINLTRLSKAMSHALRHAPDQYGLVLNAEGWADVDALLEGLRARYPAWGMLTRDDLQRAMDAANKQRYELRGGRIRALYGHSASQPVTKSPAPPPEMLYHGTAAHTLDAIRQEGLRPMRRQYVHLSEDQAAAQQVGGRHSADVVILRVRAGEAYRQGTCFYHGNQQTWLADSVPPEFIEFPAS